MTQFGRIAALRERMRASDTDLVAVGPGSHMEWLTGARPLADERPCLLLVTQRAEALVVPSLNAAEMRSRTAIDLHAWTDDHGPADALAGALVAIAGANALSVGVDETMRADFALLLLDALPRDVRKSFAAETVGLLRTVKDEDEIAALRRSAAVADLAVAATFDSARPGMTENALAAVARSRFEAAGATPAFWAVASGPESAHPHHATSDRVLQRGDVVILDIGARKDGFPSDITRMGFVGEPTADYLEIHAIVDRAVKSALAAARPGVRARDVDFAARKVITDAGYGEFFVHRTGHGIGLDIHERPYITASSEAILSEGNVFSIEPGIYLPGRFGVRLEEIVVLRSGGPDLLSTLTRDVRTIPA